MKKPTICIVGTGGTISTKYDSKTGRLDSSATIEELVATTPELSEIVTIQLVEHSNVPSDQLDTNTVFELRNTLRGVLAEEDVDGAIVTHGTATLEETAYMMDLTVGSEKPIVLTGAQRNFVEKDVDGPRNIYYSAKIASSSDAWNRGVLVSMGGEIHAARDAIKVHTHHLNAFGSRDGGAIGMVNRYGVTFFSNPERRVFLDVDCVAENVQLLVMTQGSNDLLLRACNNEKVDGIVIEGVGAGNVNRPFFDALCESLEIGIPVVVGTRILSGAAHLNKGHPGSLRSLVERGAIPAGYLSGTKARILLMVALKHTTDLNQLRGIFKRAAGVY